MKPGLALAVILPFLALAVQWLLWPWIAPFVWFLFFPTVFFSARLGGLRGGLASTLLSIAIVWYFFIPPQLSWEVANPNNLYSVVVFLAMGYLFSDSQERLRRAQDSTAAALAEARAANEKITELYRKTLELDELKSQFFANLSHELRTPLTLIISPLVRRLAATDLSAGERRESEMMLRNARILYRQVSDLLDAAKLESGRMGLSYARVDVGALTRAVAAQFDWLAAERKVAYSVDAASALLAEVDGEKLQRILLNLLSNAFKFTPEGGRIAVRLGTTPERLLLEVQDDGPGIPAAMREAVFERFRQVEGGAQRRFGGTGLGLAIVREFAQLHGGSIELAEAPGGGALFALHLPRLAPAGTLLQADPGLLDRDSAHLGSDALSPTVAAGAATIAEAGVDAPLILVVEDNPDMNAYIVDTLRPRYRVASALDGRAGLEQAVALRPDLILCDVMMPVMSGDQMVPSLRRLPGMADLPIIMLTAKADDELRLRLLKDGVQAYLSKPFSTEELLARIDVLVATRRRTLDEILRLNTELERRVLERTAELAAANQQLDSFAYTVSHDLRAPLRAMQGFSEAMVEDYGQTLQGEAKVYLEQIAIAGRKMADLVDGILALSRATRGELRRDAIDVSAQATAMLQDLARDDPQRRVAWQVAPGLKASGDARMIEVVLRNLLENAWKYTAKTAAPEIRVYAEEVRGERRFCIADNGAGFDMAHADQLFQAFRRLHRQEEFPGIGIGLATVQRIVHRHGGEVRGEAEPGAGATFCFTLPVCPLEMPS